MAVETEIKGRLGDRAALRARLAAEGARVVEERSFEDNVLLDDAQGRIFGRGQNLRLRRVAGRAELCWKGPKSLRGAVRSREEIETRCEDPEALLELLARLGFHPVFRYQKYRETWTLGTVEVMVDETPAGDFVEIEGEEEAVRAAQARLGVAEEALVADSYPTIFLRHLAARGDRSRQLVFEEAPDRG